MLTHPEHVAGDNKCFSVASAAGTRVKGGGILRREREGRGVIFGDSI